MGWSPLHTLAMEANRDSGNTIALYHPDSCNVCRVDAMNEEIYKNGCIVRERTEVHVASALQKSLNAFNIAYALLTGTSALHKACQYGQVANVEKLILEGADVSVRNHWNSTCLHWVVKGCVFNKPTSTANYTEIARLLISIRRTLLLAKDSNERTPADLAKELGAADLQTILEKAATDVQNKIKEAERKKIENKPKVRRLG